MWTSLQPALRSPLMMITNSGISLILLVFSLYLLSTRFYTSAAFERPVHFTILSLLLSAAAFKVVSIYGRKRAKQQALPLELDDNNSAASWLWQERGQKLKRFNTRPFVPLVFYLTTRTVFCWLTLRWTQCGWVGVQALVPFFVIIIDYVGAVTLKSWMNVVEAPLPNNSTTYCVMTLVWAVVNIIVQHATKEPTGTVCPYGGNRAYVPLAQLLLALADAQLLRSVSGLRHFQQIEGSNVFGKIITQALLRTAITLSIIFIPLLGLYGGTLGSFDLYATDFRDLIVDSILVTTALVSTTAVWSLMYPAAFGMVLVSTFILGAYAPHDHSGFTGRFILILLATLWMAAPRGFVILPSLPLARHQAAKRLHELLRNAYIVLFVLSVAHLSYLRISSSGRVPIRDAIGRLVEQAADANELWLKQASSSRNLAQAVAEYRRRYGIPPPRHFDKWYGFALEKNSTIIDGFDQINDDLFPFWSMEPSTIRHLTKDLLESGRVEMAGFRISNGTIQMAEANVPGTHRWMIQAVKDMIGPNVRYLADMDLAINLSDESRSAVPYEQITLIKEKALRARAEVASGDRSSEQPVPDAKKPGSGWTDKLPKPKGLLTNHLYPHGFSNDMHRQIFYEKVGGPCPPSSKARTSRWWDWNTPCLWCAAPHSVLTDSGFLISNVSLANNLCHQPDMAYLNGFVMSSADLIGTTDLMPIFSQGKFNGFNDILFPSPWNYVKKTEYKEKTDIPWSKKMNGLYWRGSSTDGYGAHSSWAGFTRTRYVNEGYQRSKWVHTAPEQFKTPTVNMSFAGDVWKCDDADCVSQLETFHEWAAATRTLSGLEPPEKPKLKDDFKFEMFHDKFRENWKYKHLIDFDGSGFSGRFIPFLESKSLIYRVALVNTWIDERIRAWHHYVPVDMRFSRSFWSLIRYFGGLDDGDRGRGRGNENAEKIAAEGRRWAKQALRQEDMQVYIFRLMLEWGRLVSDDRAVMNFDMSDVSTPLNSGTLRKVRRVNDS